LRNLEQAFLESFDPFFHLKQAQLIKTNQMTTLSAVSRHIDGTDEPIFNEHFGDNLELCRSISCRFIRFHSADTMISLLCGGFPILNTLKVLSEYRNDKYNNIVNSISQRSVPKEMNSQDFSSIDEWIRFRIRGDYHRDVEIDETIINTIGDDANLKLKASGVSWLKYSGKANGEIQFGVMDLNIEADVLAIGLHSVINKLMVDIRLAHLRGGNTVLHIPENLRKIPFINVISMKAKL